MALQEERFKRFIRNECSSREIEELLAEFSDAANESELRQIIIKQLEGEDLTVQPSLPDLEEKEQAIYAAIEPHIIGHKILLWPRIAAAASVLLLLSIGGYFLLHRTTATQIATVKPGVFKNDVDPGNNNAILTLSGGNQIVLKSAKKGLLAKQGAVQIQKTGDGALQYEAPNVPAKEVLYNTVTTRRGNKCNVTLPDGSIAYLDAASSIHFPTAFTGNTREISVTGQVYLEVAHDKTKPFRVTVKGETIEVLGTHFNINSYDDETFIRTTLLEGSVKISGNGQNTLLVPGQQAQLGTTGQIIVTREDVDEVMAWKNGLFRFNSTDLQTTMRQLSRWYDVDVVYQGEAKSYHFVGYISRDSRLSEVLKILQLSGVRFSIDGKKIIVYE